MGFFSDLLGIEKPKEQRTRADMEDKLFVLNKRTNGQKRGAQDSEKQILKDVFDIIEEVPETKKLLDDVAKMGYKFFFMKETGNIDAECITSDKLIMLNPTKYKHVSNMAIDIVHEMTHAMQAKEYADMGNNFSGLNLADQMKVHRAKEAGACLEQSKFAMQILDKHPESLKYVQNDLMMSTYKSEMEKSGGDKTKAAEACFKSWYSQKDGTNELYDDLKVELCIQDIDNTRHKDKILSQSISAEKIIQSSIYSPELKNAVPPEFLDSKEANKLTLKAKERLDTVSKNCDKYYGAKDASYKEMYSYDSDMKHADQEKDTSLMAQLKQKQAEEEAKKKAAEAKTETKQASAGSTLMGMLAGIAVDMAFGAAKHQVANVAQKEVMKVIKGNGGR